MTQENQQIEKVNNTPLTSKNPKSVEALEHIWTEYKLMRFGYFAPNKLTN